MGAADIARLIAYSHDYTMGKEVQGQPDDVRRKLQLVRFDKRYRQQVIWIWLNWDPDFERRWIELVLQADEIDRMSERTAFHRWRKEKAREAWATEFFEMAARILGVTFEEASLLAAHTELWGWIFLQIGKMRIDFCRGE